VIGRRDVLATVIGDLLPSGLEEVAFVRNASSGLPVFTNKMNSKRRFRRAHGPNMKVMHFVDGAGSLSIGDIST
jgi:hypothetical protein